MNGKPWLEPASWSQYAFGGIYYSDTCRFTPVGGIAIISFTEDPFIRESFGVSFIPLKVGRYLIKGKVTPCDTLLFAALELYAADGDAGAGLYKRLESVESSITIDSYDKITGNVSGSFDITFVKDYKSAGYFDNYTDTVRFNGGTFKTKWLPK